MMMLIDPYRYGVSGPATIELMYGEFDPGGTSFPGAGTVTISSLDFGDVVPGRLMVATVYFTCLHAMPTLTSATIGGVGAGILVHGAEMVSDFTDVHDRTAIIAALVPTATSGDVVFSFDEGDTRVHTVCLYRATNIASSEAFDTASGLTSSPSTSLSINIDEAAGGVVVVMGETHAASDPQSMSGATLDFSSVRSSAGSAATATAATGATITQTDTSFVTGDSRTLIAASFR